MGKVESSYRVAHFEGFQLDLRSGELCREGDKPVSLAEQPFRILAMLLERPGDLVTREEIRDALWPNGTVVEFEHSISAAINRLRQVLGDSVEEPRYIETLARRGYRWRISVEWVERSREAAEPAKVEAGAGTRAQADQSLIGKKVSHYRVLEVLGGGGMGVVYKAEDLRLGRRVALKFLPEELASDPAALNRFEREARAASALSHPNICTIFEVEEYEQNPFIVMELLEGETLREVISRARPGKPPVELEKFLDLAIQISDGLDAAHRQGIIHRDIKPANIFVIRESQAKILDFGLAKLAHVVSFAENESERRARDDCAQQTPLENDRQATPDPFLSRTGEAMGTAGYMSPEQVRGEMLDARTDLFSFGLVLYEMATGQRAFKGDTGPVLHDAILKQIPTPARVLNPEIPAKLEAVINRALEKDRMLRFQSAAEIRTDLQRLRRDTDSALLPAASSAVVAVGEQRRIRWKLIVSAAISIVALAAGIFIINHRTTKLTEKDTIVLADFANTTGDSVFDDTLKTALNVSLRQSPFLNVLSDNEVARTLQQMTRPSSTKLTRDLARELCQRAGSKAYLAGSIASLGSEYVLGLKAVNCQSGETLAQELVTAASKEQVLDALGKAASKLRGELGESLASVQKFDVPLAQATTSSLEALKAYSLGQKTFREKGVAAALPYNQRAIEIDPNFAMGYRAVGIEYGNLAEVGRASEYITKAYQLREHASEREKLEITAAYYSTVTGQVDKAVQTYQEEIESYPRDSLGYLNLGVEYGALGQYEKAAEVTRQGLRLAPDQIRLYEVLADFTVALQRFDETRQVIREAQARKMDDSELRSALYALAFLGADPAAMADQQQWFASKPEYESYGLSLASDTEAYAGHLGKARELTKRAVDSAIRADSKESGAIWQAYAALQLAAYGNAAEARQSAAEALKLAPTSPGAESEAALAFAMASDTPRAESLAQDLGKRFPLDTQMQSLWLPAIQAQLALDKKNPVVALNTLQAASPIELGNIPFANNTSCLYHVFVRGEAFLAAGQASAAVGEFQKILDHGGIVLYCWTGALAHLGVARANALEARNTQGADADAARVRALAAYHDFLTLWKDADPYIPILIAAKSEYAKLQ